MSSRDQQLLAHVDDIWAGLQTPDQRRRHGILQCKASSVKMQVPV